MQSELQKSVSILELRAFTNTYVELRANLKYFFNTAEFIYIYVNRDRGAKWQECIFSGRDRDTNGKSKKVRVKEIDTQSKTREREREKERERELTERE